MIYGKMHHQQMLSRLVPIKEFTSKPIELHDGRYLVDQDYWRVQIGRYPLDYGSHNEFNQPIFNMPMNGSKYVIWGFFETKNEAINYASDAIRKTPWFYGGD